MGYTLLSSDGFREKSRLQQEQAALEGRVKRLQTDNAMLAEQARALRDERGDNALLEEAVRSELGYVKKDEVVILTGDETAPTGDAPAVSDPASENASDRGAPDAHKDQP